jgi:hypothetical protein
MATFGDLLRSTTAHLNRRGLPLAISVLLFGCVSIALWVLALRTLNAHVMNGLEKVLGRESAARIERQVRSIGSQADIEGFGAAVLEEAETVLRDVPRDKQADLLLSAVLGSMRSALPQFLLIGFALVALWLWVRAFFLVLACRPKDDWWPMMLRALRLLPRLLGVWLTLWSCLMLWYLLLGMLFVPFLPSAFIPIMVIGVSVAIYIAPRVVLAPVYAVQDGRGIAESMQRSLRVSDGRWARILGSLVAMMALVWLATMLAQIMVNLLVRLALPFSVFALFLGQVMTFIALIAAAYRTVFLVKLKEDLTQATSQTAPRR